MTNNQLVIRVLDAVLGVLVHQTGFHEGQIDRELKSAVWKKALKVWIYMPKDSWVFVEIDSMKDLEVRTFPDLIELRYRVDGKRELLMCRTSDYAVQFVQETEDD